VIALAVWKGDRKIATTTKYSLQRPYKDSPAGTPINWTLWPGLDSIALLHFSRVTLEPPVLFEHLSGLGLASFFDHSEFRVEGDRRKEHYADLRYVHGRSEVLRGNPAISAVVLAKIAANKDFDERRFKTQLPAIYQEFLRCARGTPEVGA
jgi:hypothetical protein